MRIRKNNQVKRDKSHKRLFLILLSLLVIFSGFIFPGYGEAEVISRGPHLKQVGPINDFNGFPLWYKDSNNVKLQLCLDPFDEYCGLVVEDFDANEPVVFPTNYPGEAFYQLAEARIRDGRNDAIGVFALEATFNQEVPAVDDQTVFGRIRFRVDGLRTGQTYTITHPYGIDKIVATNNEINYTEDIGAGQAFNGAQKSRIGTYLKWDPAVGPEAPVGYIGDPNVDHQIIGGVNGQNYFRIEGPGIGNSYPNFKCTPNSNDCIQTTMFSIAGKIATNNGLEVQQATYNQTTADSGSIDVFVYSDVDQTIDVSGDGIVKTSLTGGDGQYYAHVSYTGAKPPAKITVTNTSDTPVTAKNVALVDRIIAAADYNPLTKTLTVTAKSSNEVDQPTLSVNGYGDINPETGSLIISDVSYISPTITITSSNKGTITIPVNITITPIIPELVTPIIGEDQSITIGSQDSITLDGSRSIGDIESYAWTFIRGPEDVEVTDANKAIVTFPTPTTPGEYIFQLTVTGPNRISASKNTKIIILDKNPVPVTEDEQSIIAGSQESITLDGSKSTGLIESFAWTFIEGPEAVAITNADKKIATFPTPTTPGEYIFQLTVTGFNGLSTSKITRIIVLDKDPIVPEPIANAGPDQTVKQGSVVTLDGSGSENATTYSWKQDSGRTVILNNANTAYSTFTFPRQLDTLVFELTVTGSDGKTATDTVVISTVPDNLTVSDAEFRSKKSEWRIDGTSDVFGPGVIVTIKFKDSANPNGVKLGTANVDIDGTWRFRGAGPEIRQGGTLTIESSSGGILTNAPVSIKN